MANEKRLIDAMQTVTKMSGRVTPLLKMCANPVQAYNTVLQVIAEADTVDAVEVIRCKDCKHWHEETGWCNEHSHFIGSSGEACHPWESSDWKMFDADYFCKDGERKQ